MPIDSINSSGAGNIRSLDQVRKVNNDLGKDAFLQILVAQLSNQDPLSPTSDTEFIAQMAQFSALEQMQNMNASMQSQMAYGFLGKEITANHVVDGNGSLYQREVYGQVVAVVKQSGREYLQVLDYESNQLFLVPADQVTSAMDSGSIERYLANLTALLGQVVSNTAPAQEQAPDAESSQQQPDTAGGQEPVGD